jgi:hypothetical protein
MGGLSGIVETVRAIPGVGDILRPNVGPMLDVLKALGA